MSSTSKGLRRVGIVGLSTLVVTSMMTLTAASSFAAASTFALSGTVTHVSQGQASAPAGDLTLGFDNTWTTLAAQTFTVGANDCSTAAGISAAVEFSALPVITVTDPAPANVGARTPYSTPVLGSSTLACASAGITDLLTITQPLPSTGVAADRWVMDLTNIKYNVGATRAPGDISVVGAGLFTGAITVANANIPVVNFTNTDRVAALPSALGVSLGTQSFAEGTAGAIFTGGAATIVTMTLPVGVFTTGVTPTITAPATYTVTTPVATTGANTYAFTVTAPATALKATVTVAGLKADVDAAIGTRVITAVRTAGALALGSVNVVNVVNYGARIGGADRYATAAALFDSGFGTVDNVVLSGGLLFPDALSANYLAGKLGTGTLLTSPTSLSSEARAQIYKASVKTVFITGGTGAISQAVQNSIEAMHQSNNPANPLINTVRLGGADRYVTNRLVNEYNFTASSTVLLAAGTGFADALAMGPVAYTGDATVAGNGYPLIITQGATLGTNEMTQLSDFSPTNVVIAGGTGVVSLAIETSLKAQGYTVLRLAGVDRTLTAAAIAGWATVGVGTSPTGINANRGFHSTTTHVTTGTGFADALAAGPVAGSTGTLIVLSSSPTALGAGIPAYLGTKLVGAGAQEVTTLNALGLTGATSNALMKAAAATIGLG